MAFFKPMRWHMLSRLAVAAAVLGMCGVGAIEWSMTTSSTSEFVDTANVGEIVEFSFAPGERYNIEFVGEPSNHFAVSYRQCSLEDPQPLQIQYSDKLQYLPFVGGCLYAENAAAGRAAGSTDGIRTNGCTFWQYNPSSEMYSTSGQDYTGRELLEPGRVRFENQGTGNATVEVAMYSELVPAPASLANLDIWIEDSFIKKDRVVNTSVNVYFNNDDAFCEKYTCTVTGYLNEYVEGQESLSLCQVLADGAVVHEEPFTTYIPLSFELPARNEYFVTVVLSAKNSTKAAADYAALVETGQDKIVVFQTGSFLPDSSARIFAGVSLVPLIWLILLNTLLSSLGLAGGQRDAAIPTLGW